MNGSKTAGIHEAGDDDWPVWFQAGARRQENAAARTEAVAWANQSAEELAGSRARRAWAAANQAIYASLVDMAKTTTGRYLSAVLR